MLSKISNGKEYAEAFKVMRLCKPNSNEMYQCLELIEDYENSVLIKVCEKALGQLRSQTPQTINHHDDIESL